MLKQWLDQSKYTVIFSGAGMSTESGVPDFRSATGWWQGRDPQKLASVEAMVYHTEEFIDFYRMRMRLLQSIEPHEGYDILTAWGKSSSLKSVITQNTDGLHEQAGNPHVIPIHGTIRQLHCRVCKQTYVMNRYLSSDDYYCECGGFIRPSVILFGESLDQNLLLKANTETAKADLFIVLGSSLTVSPANQYPLLAKERGAKLVIINHDPTPLDSYADLVINQRKIGEVLREVSQEP